MTLSLTHFSDSGLPVRNVGQASLQRPHSVQVKASRPSFHVRSLTVCTPMRMSASSPPSPMIVSRSTFGTALVGPPLRKKSVGSAVTMWKCSPTGRITRNANTTSSCAQ